MKLDVNGAVREVDARPTCRCSGCCATSSASPAPSTAAAWPSAAPAPCTSTASRCARASRRSRRSAPARSPPSRASRPTGPIPCSAPGPRSTSSQCGYCQSGQIMTAAALLAEKPDADRRRHRRRALGQHLPLRHVPAHPRGRPPRRGAQMGAEPCALTPVATSSAPGRRRRRPGHRLRRPAPRRRPRAGAAKAPLPPPHAFLRIGADDSVTVVLAHSEMGQGIWTGARRCSSPRSSSATGRRSASSTRPRRAGLRARRCGIQMTGGSSTT